MAPIENVTALIEREAEGYAAHCPDLDVASQGDTVEEALANLREAVQLFLETASEGEIDARYHPDLMVARLSLRVA